MDFLRPTKRSYESVDLERGGEVQLNVWRGEGKVKIKEKGNPSFFAQMTIYDCVLIYYYLKQEVIGDHVVIFLLDHRLKKWTCKIQDQKKNVELCSRNVTM
jgi:hypothetical protein